jgi:hypothetical protein
VAVVGPPAAGKSALVSAFLGPGEGGEPGEGKEWAGEKTVAGRAVTFLVREAREQQAAADWADVILLCFSVASEPPVFRTAGPGSPPLVLVGCQADRRRVRPLLRGPTLVSARRALDLSRRLGAVMYVETEAAGDSEASRASVAAAFEVAALAHLGHLRPAPPPPRERAGSVPPPGPSASEFWGRFRSPVVGRRGAGLRAAGRVGSLGSLGLGSLSSLAGRGAGEVRPVHDRRGRRPDTGERLVTIRCQRMTREGMREEVDIAVPVSVYNMLESPPLAPPRLRAGERRGGRLAARIRTWLVRV